MKVGGGLGEEESRKRLERVWKEWKSVERVWKLSGPLFPTPYVLVLRNFALAPQVVP
jgi:hypothetical protein